MEIESNVSVIEAVNHKNETLFYDCFRAVYVVKHKNNPVRCRIDRFCVCNSQRYKGNQERQVNEAKITFNTADDM